MSPDAAGPRGWLTPARRRVLGLVGGVALLVLALLVVRYGPDPGTTASPTGGQTSSATSKTTPSRTSATAAARDPDSGLRVIDLSSLPAQARSTVALIQRGGPYPYPGKDGSTYRNSNGVLPRHSLGFYREYTVRTPGESDRGARRIVTGGQASALQFFYTSDHYDSFSRVRVG